MALPGPQTAYQSRVFIQQSIMNDTRRAHLLVSKLKLSSATSASKENVLLSRMATRLLVFSREVLDVPLNASCAWTETGQLSAPVLVLLCAFVHQIYLFLLVLPHLFSLHESPFQNINAKKHTKRRYCCG